ncbi:MAG TPA: Rieske 2Fe-2S domain-containing protein [Steroidobacteraceae bacterium]|nr:Rieske 2Fe-2S domain-containing protein [Steroidobacteraceae bacterium]
MGAELDLERVICRLADLEEHGSRAFTVGGGDWPLRGFVVRHGNEIRGYVNRCPHAGHPLDLRPHRFLTPDRALILCASHGALFEKDEGRCLAGPCAGQQLRPVPLEVIGDVVLLAADADLAALAADG